MLKGEPQGHSESLILPCAKLGYKWKALKRGKWWLATCQFQIGLSVGGRRLGVKKSLGTPGCFWQRVRKLLRSKEMSCALGKRAKERAPSKRTGVKKSGNEVAK